MSVPRANDSEDLEGVISKLEVRTCASAQSSAVPPRKVLLPVITWRRIFCHLKSRHDLMNAAMTCRLFYLNSVDLLYERLVLMNPLHFLGCRDVMIMLVATTKHVTIGFSPCPYFLIPIEVTSMERNINAQRYGLHCNSILDDYHSQPPFASDSLYSSLISTCARFTHLESLVFVRTYIPPTSLTILCTLPFLLSLVLHHCYYPDRGDDDISQMMQLRTLSLRELSFHDQPNFDGLLSSPTLLELSIDDTSADAINPELVRSLRRLQVFRARGPSPHKMHPDDVQEVVSWITYNNPAIEDILTEFGLGPHLSNGLEKALKYYVGPFSTLSLFDTGYLNLIALELTSDITTADHIKPIVSAFQNLSCLSLIVDGTFVHHLSAINLRSLKRLNLAYFCPIPTDELQDHLNILAGTLVPLGGLRSLGYFPTEAIMGAATGKAFNLDPFSQSGLLEVRLHHDYIWRRAGALCTEWKQLTALVYHETRVLPYLVNPILD